MAVAALRVCRLVGVPPPRPRCYARQYASIHGSLYVAQDLVTSTVTTPIFFPSQCLRRAGHSNTRSPCNRLHKCSIVNAQRFINNVTDGRDIRSNEEPGHSKIEQPKLIYEGPFASVALKLKRVSLTSAIIAIVGLPALTVLCGDTGSVPAMGQISVIATAGVTAVGSTVLLGYCFSPYVHTLERLPGNNASDDEEIATGNDQVHHTKNLVRLITRDILARRVETIFDPTTDVSAPAPGNTRPFCNFIVKGLPMYVHPELVNDTELREQLFGEDPQQENAEARNKQKTDDDEFL